MRFSAKEAIYKCQFPLTRTFLGFHDVAVTFERDGSFSTRLLPALPRLQECGRFVGRWSCHDGFLLTGAWIEHPTDGR
jgi:4'-phosphopantetheinyl transferase EntD